MSATPRLTIIAAVTADGGLGRQGQLLYRLKPDMRRFRDLTMGHPIVMGRRTFEGFPKGPLPGRTNIVVSRTLGPRDGIVVARSLPDALLQAARADGGREEVFILGGAEIYRQAVTLANRLDITQIDVPSPAGTDAWFPPVPLPAVTAPLPDSPWLTDPATALRYRFLTLPLTRDGQGD